MLPEENKALVRRFVEEGLNRRDWQVLESGITLMRTAGGKIIEDRYWA